MAASSSELVNIVASFIMDDIRAKRRKLDDINTRAPGILWEYGGVQDMDYSGPLTNLGVGKFQERTSLGYVNTHMMFSLKDGRGSPLAIGVDSCGNCGKHRGFPYPRSRTVRALAEGASTWEAFFESMLQQCRGNLRSCKYLPDGWQLVCPFVSPALAEPSVFSGMFSLDRPNGHSLGLLAVTFAKSYLLYLQNLSQDTVPAGVYKINGPPGVEDYFVATVESDHAIDNVLFGQALLSPMRSFTAYVSRDLKPGESIVLSVYKKEDVPITYPNQLQEGPFRKN